MFIEANKPVTVHDLVYGMIIQSGNDAAIALAELVGGSEAQFVTLMNAEAARLGMKNTHFADVNGMPDAQHYTTAADLAVLSTHLIRDFPEYYTIFSVKEFTYKQHQAAEPQPPAVARPDGRRPEDRPYAGRWLLPDRVGEAFVAGRAGCVAPSRHGDDGRREGTRSRAGQPEDAELRVLLAYDTVRLYKAGQVIETPRIYKGVADTVKIGVKSDQYITVPRGMGDKVKPVVEHVEPLVAPLADGQAVGTVKLVADGKTLAQFPAVVLQAVPEAGIAGRVWDSLMLMFNKKK